MHIDENGLHPFTVARMTDHNVRGMDADETFNDNLSQDQALKRDRLNAWEDEGGEHRLTGGI